LREWLETWLSINWFDNWLSEPWVKNTWKNRILLALAWPFFVVGGVADFLTNCLDTAY